MKNNKGVTLIELLVVLAIVGIVIAAAAGLMSNSLNTYKNNDAQWQTQQDGRFAVQKISNDVRSAYSIDLPADGGSSSELKLDGESVRILCGSGESKNTLYRVVNGVSSPIIYDVDSISFARDGSIITLTMTTKKSGNDNKFTISTKLYSRASH